MEILIRRPALVRDQSAVSSRAVEMILDAMTSWSRGHPPVAVAVRGWYEPSRPPAEEQYPAGIVRDSSSGAVAAVAVTPLAASRIVRRGCWAISASDCRRGSGAARGCPRSR